MRYLQYLQTCTERDFREALASGKLPACDDDNLFLVDTICRLSRADLLLAYLQEHPMSEAADVPLLQACESNATRCISLLFEAPEVCICFREEKQQQYAQQRPGVLWLNVNTFEYFALARKISKHSDLQNVTYFLSNYAECFETVAFFRELFRGACRHSNLALVQYLCEKHPRIYALFSETEAEQSLSETLLAKDFAILQYLFKHSPAASCLIKSLTTSDESQLRHNVSSLFFLALLVGNTSVVVYLLSDFPFASLIQLPENQDDLLKLLATSQKAEIFEFLYFESRLQSLIRITDADNYFVEFSLRFRQFELLRLLLQHLRKQTLSAEKQLDIQRALQRSFRIFYDLEEDAQCFLLSCANFPLPPKLRHILETEESRTLFDIQSVLSLLNLDWPTFLQAIQNPVVHQYFASHLPITTETIKKLLRSPSETTSRF